MLLPGLAATEAPRGLLHHTYRIDADGLIEFAQIVPPTSQNQATIEDDLGAFIAPRLALADDDLTIARDHQQVHVRCGSSHRVW